MAYRRNYPATVAEVLVEGKTYKPGTLAALRRFRAAKPWQGTVEERAEKIRVLYRELAAVYRIEAPTLRVSPSAIDAYWPPVHTIRLNASNLSVVTALHEFGHALGKDERLAVRWSVNLFRRIFPRSYARLNHVGHTLRRRPVLPPEEQVAEDECLERGVPYPAGRRTR